MRRWLIAAAFAASFIGCNGPTTPSSGPVGRWEGSFAEVGGDVGRLSLDINESDRPGLAGAWGVEFSDPSKSTSGRISGRTRDTPNEIDLLMTSSRVCSFSGTSLVFVLTAKVSGNVLDGTMAGLCSPAIEGVVTLRRR